MAEHDDSLMEELIAESKEHLEAIEPHLMALEENPGAVAPEAVNSIFRAVHSIKGGFGFFSMNHIKELAHSMENVMGLVRDGELTVTPAIVDVLLSGTDKLRVLIDDVHASDNISIDEDMAQLSKILDAQQQGSSEKEAGDSAATPMTGETPESAEALEILRTPGSDALADDASNRLGELLHLLHDQVAEGGKAYAEDLLGDYDACVSTMGLDGLLREVLVEKLEKLAPFLPTPAPTEQAAPQDASALPPPPRESSAPSPVEKPPEKSTAGTKESTATQSLRVRVDLLDNLMNLAGELVLGRNRIKRTLADKLSSGMAANPQLGRLKEQLSASRKCLDDSVRASGNGSAQALAGTVAKEFDNINSCLRQLLDSTFSDLPGIGGAVQDIDTVTSELQGGIMSTRMQLVGSVFSKFPRVIRDMNRKLGKEMELTIVGENVELDKSIIEALGDPLTHLIRNSADHGIEAPEAREAAGKPTQGTIELIARHEGGQVYIEIIDDGAGIDAKRLKGKAVERGTLTEKDAAEMSDREALRLIFAPGFSMAEKVSDVSGRGVGMDVVRSNIEKIGGTVDIETTLGQGSRITLKLPLTLAIMPALIIQHEGRVFAMPQVDIEELVRIRACDAAQRIESVHGKPAMRLREKVLPLVSLSEVLGIEGTFLDSTRDRKPDRRQHFLDRRANDLAADDSAHDDLAADDLAADDSAHDDSAHDADADAARPRHDRDRRYSRRSAFNVVVLRAGPNRYGIIVEKLMDSEEIVVKPLPDHLKKCPAYAGVTIMGDGRIAMILDATGMSAAGRLRFGTDLEEAESIQSHAYNREIMKEKQSLLLFRNATSEHFAISLSMIKRIEKIDQSAIEKVDNKEFLKYESSSLRLLRLHDFLPVKAPEQRSEKCFVIVPRLVRHPMGIIVSAVEDVLETSAPLDAETITGTGILGSLIVGGAMLICVDVYDLFEAAEPDIYRVASGEMLRGKRVLLAEDTAFFRSVESAYLRELGCDVEVAVDGEEAWTKLSDTHFDLLVTDIQMPLLDGLGLTARVRASQQHKEMPIVALTSLINEKDRRRILDAGVDAYETKLDKESLRNTLETLTKQVRR